MSSESPIQDGLVDPSVYFDPLEGPYTRVAKFCLINGVFGKRADKVLFGERNYSRPRFAKKRSLLYCASLRCAKGLHKLGNTIFSGSLHDIAGTWASLIGTDLHLRFCPECISSGFQSSIYQIAAVVWCPIHQNTKLQDRCSQCGQLTQDYTFEAASRSFPFQCIHCKTPFGGMFFDNTNQAVKSSIAAVREMHRWLLQVGQIDSRKLTWDGIPDAIAYDNEVFRSVQFFSFLRSFIPPPKSLRGSCTRVFCSSKSENFCRYEYGVDLDALQPRIYRSIRRWIEHRFSILRIFRKVGYSNIISANFENGDNIEHFDRVLLNGWLRWRHRFEFYFLEFLSANKFGLKNIAWRTSTPSMLLRPQVIFAPDFAGVDIDCWANFVLQSFYEDMREAIAWYKRATLEIDPFQRACLNNPQFYLRGWRFNSPQCDVNHPGVHQLELNFPGVKDSYSVVFSLRDAETDYFLQHAADRISSSKAPDLCFFSQWRIS